MPLEVMIERFHRAEVAVDSAQLADHESGQVGLLAFHVVGIHAVVADFGVGHAYDLAAVTGIGEDLLVAGHGGVEAHLAIDLAGRAERIACVNRAIFESEFSDWHIVVALGRLERL